MNNYISYSTLRAMNLVKARKIVIRFYLDNKRNISKTARFFLMDRKTVRRIIKKLEKKGYHNMTDDSRAPKTIISKTNEKTEKLVIIERKKTNYGRKRLALRLKTEYTPPCIRC